VGSAWYLQRRERQRTREMQLAAATGI
jgi:hypothetical protein